MCELLYLNSMSLISQHRVSELTNLNPYRYPLAIGSLLDQLQLQATLYPLPHLPSLCSLPRGETFDRVTRSCIVRWVRGRGALHVSTVYCDLERFVCRKI